MVDDNYIVYKCLENPQMMGEIRYCDLKRELKTMVSIIIDTVQDKMKKYIIIYNDKIAQIKIRVFSTNKASRRYVEAICSYEFILGTTFDVFEKHFLSAINEAIEKTIESMGVTK